MLAVDVSSSDKHIIVWHRIKEFMVQLWRGISIDER
jgi:hypothetical protein